MGPIIPKPVPERFIETCGYTVREYDAYKFKEECFLRITCHRFRACFCFLPTPTHTSPMEQSTTSLFSSAALISKKTLRTLRDDFFISQNMSERVTKMVRRLREGVFKTSAFCFVGLPNFMQQAVKVNQQKQSRRSAHATVSGLFDLGLNYDTIGIH